MPVTFPLVGRREELELIEQTLSRPELAGVILAGEAGVGKTRLAREAVSLGGRRGLPTAWASATQAGKTVPFGALAHLLPPTPPAGFTREDVIRAAGEGLAQRFEGHRAVVGIDDAHLLDEHSAVLLHHLAQSGGAFIVAAVRTGEEAPDPITALWKDELCDRLEIQALSEAEIGEILEGALGGRVETATTHRLWEQTRGNPLFLRELFLGGLETGALREDDELWRWHGSVAQSPRLREVIDKRLGRLSHAERQVLETVAAAEPLGARLLETLVPREIIESLEESSLLTEERDDRREFVRLAHPLYAEALRIATPPSRARAVIGRLAESLEASGIKRREDVLRLATWNLEAGRAGGPEVFLPAAAQALGVCDFPLGERLARAASEGGAGTPSAFLLAQALMGQGRFEEAESVLSGLEAGPVSELERTQAASLRAHNLFWNLGRLERSHEVLESAEAAVTDPALKDEVSAARAYILFISGQADQAIRRGRAVLEREGASDGAITNAMGALGQALQFAGRPEGSLEIWERWVSRALPVLRTLPIAPVAETVFPFWAHWFSGRFEQAADIAERAYRVALNREAGWVRGFLACLAAIAARARGQVSTAVRWAQEGTAYLRQTDFLGQLPLFLAEMAQALALQGRAAEAEDIVREAEGGRLQAMAQSRLAMARVWVLAARGELSRARKIAREGATAMGSMGYRSDQAILLHDVARLGEPATVVRELEQLAGDSDSRWIKMFPIHARALADADAAGLLEVSTEFEDMGALLLAAECAAEASRVFKENGRAGSSLAAAERAAALAAMCEGARTPALAAIGTALPVTSREREIGLLAARGLSNREIADRLVISPRTVGNHLHNMYAKLGVEGREELGAILEPSANGSS